MESGRCVEPGEECTPDGEFVPCGPGEFPPICGPGAACVADVCVASAPCMRVICDAGGVCRGTECGAASGATIRGVELDPVEDAARGTVDGLSVGASVEGDDLCGATVTFEVRVETAVYTSAGNDGSVFEVDLESGARTSYIDGLPIVHGLVTDRAGDLYVLRSDTCEVGRIVGDAGARTFEALGAASAGCARLAIGLDGALYVAGGLLVERIDVFSGEVTPFGSIEDGVARWNNTFLTGLTFAPDGRLIVGEHWDGLFAIDAMGGVGTRIASGPALTFVQSDNPWNEGLAYDEDGILHVGVFPSNPLTGFIYTMAEDGTTALLEDLASIQADVPATNYTGIHGLAFGLDGSLYFTNQNTQRNTMEPLGQILVRTSSGIRVLSDGINFDWPRGYDGDVVVGTRVVDSMTATVGVDGRAEGTLDVPDIDGAYQVRVYATDPASGRVYSDVDAARTL